MVSALDSESNDPGSRPGRGAALCSWARHFTLTVHLSTQLYNGYRRIYCWGVTLNATETGISSSCMGHLARTPTLMSLVVQTIFGYFHL